MVVLGASFAAVAPGHFVINGDSADDFAALLQALGADFFARCSRVVHLVGCVPRGELPTAALFAAQQLTLQSALRVAQALGRSSRVPERVLWLLTSGVFPPAGAPPNLVGSPLWGLGRTMAIEYPTCFGGLVDLDFDPVTAGAAQWADVLTVVSSPDDEFQLRLHERSRLVARIRALIRRSNKVADTTLRHGALVLDTATHAATLAGAPLELTPREWAILEILLLASPNVVSKDRLVQGLAGWDKDITPNAVEVHVSRLRAKLGQGGIEIRTVRGIGYRLDAPEDVAAGSAAAAP